MQILFLSLSLLLSDAPTARAVLRQPPPVSLCVLGNVKQGRGENAARGVSALRDVYYSAATILRRANTTRICITDEIIDGPRFSSSQIKLRTRVISLVTVTHGEKKREKK